MKQVLVEQVEAAKRVAKNVLKRLSPPAMAWIRQRRNRSAGNKIRAMGVERLTDRFVEKYGASVQTGPFAGMSYISAATCSALLPKLVGSYEAELHPWIEVAVRRGYDRIVDVGAAEGYYAVGFARRCPFANIYAFDIDIAAQAMCKQLAEINNVSSRIVIDGACEAGNLQSTLVGNCLIISDCEGYEDTLLYPIRVPSLQNSDIIVELHETLKPKILNRLHERFETSHEIAIEKVASRSFQAFQCLEIFSHADQAVATNELRYGRQRWAFLKAHHLGI